MYVLVLGYALLGGHDGCVLCTDADRDLYAVEGGPCGPVDCDDSDPVVHPGAYEGTGDYASCSDGTDNDCDGLVDLDDLDCNFYDTDVDGVPDIRDLCPLDNPDDADGDGLCDSAPVLGRGHPYMVDTSTIVNVLDFGADPDWELSGADDSTEAFQAAIDAIPDTGGVLLVPAGKYEVSDTLVVDKAGPVHILGVGAGPYWGSSIFWSRTESADHRPLLRLIGAGDSVVEKLSFSSTPSFPLEVGVQVETKRGRGSSRMTFRDVMVHGGAAGGLGTGFRFLAGDDALCTGDVPGDGTGCDGDDSAGAHHYFERVFVYIFSEKGFSLEHPASKGHLFVRSGYGGGDGYQQGPHVYNRKGVSTLPAPGRQGGGYFTWLLGQGGQVWDADFVLAPPNGPILIDGDQHEHSNRVIRTEGTSQDAWPVTFARSRWDRTYKASPSFEYHLRGPLTIEGNLLSEQEWPFVEIDPGAGTTLYYVNNNVGYNRDALSRYAYIGCEEPTQACTCEDPPDLEECEFRLESWTPDSMGCVEVDVLDDPGGVVEFVSYGNMGYSYHPECHGSIERSGDPTAQVPGGGFGPAVVASSRELDFTLLHAMDTTEYPSVFDVTELGAIPGDGVDDSAAFQAAIDAVPPVHDPDGSWGRGGGVVYVPAGIYEIASPLLMDTYSVILFSGEGSGVTILEWTGAYQEGIPLLRLRGTRDSIFQGFTILASIAHPLHAGIQSITVPPDDPDSRPATNNAFFDVVIDGTDGGIEYGWRITPGPYYDEYGDFQVNDGNNENHHFNGCVVRNYGVAAWSIEHSQAKTQAFLDCRFESNGYGDYGVTTYAPVVQGWSPSGSFYWIGGGGDGNNDTDFYLGSSCDFIAIRDGVFENSVRFLWHGASAGPWAVSIINNRWSTDRLIEMPGHATYHHTMINFDARGPLVVKDNVFEVNHPDAKITMCVGDEGALSPEGYPFDHGSMSVIHNDFAYTGSACHSQAKMRDWSTGWLTPEQIAAREEVELWEFANRYRDLAGEVVDTHIECGTDSLAAD